MWLQVPAKYYTVCMYLVLILPQGWDADCYHLPTATENTMINSALSFYLCSIQ